MDGGVWVAALLFVAVAVAVFASATTGDKVDTPLSGFLWTLLLVGVVAGVVWGLGAWVVGG